MRSFASYVAVSIALSLAANSLPTSSAAVVVVEAAEQTYPCAGCLKRSDGWADSITSTNDECKVEVRGKYTSWWSDCPTQSSVYCHDKVCKFEWKLERRVVAINGGTQLDCNGCTLGITETSPQTRALVQKCLVPEGLPGGSLGTAHPTAEGRGQGPCWLGGLQSASLGALADKALGSIRVAAEFSFRLPESRRNCA